ncbi:MULTISPECIES: response regulator transcription factor [Priestia]|jgi:two-component system, OmpR family, response regulator YxdJ|uniref:response regulator transcription factor n=1 Tax=Priestia TaxID=2800373 RepID=UPI00203C4658|nr:MULTISPECIES: response regulator transcription factor [Priestia]MCM3769289.1 response regulator transcription factor [Priestia aryabhattai]MDY0938702.1 response regulator transcription factor [Priestia megaterium]
MFKILIVEDDPKIACLLEEHLHKYGLEAQSVKSFDTILNEFQEINPHLVLLDVNLPKFDGFYWCRQIRALSTCPILFISARDGKMDQVMALENGADDYITKPFDYDIAIAKINSHLRRAYGSYAANKQERIIRIEELTLFPERLTLEFNCKTVELSHTESKIIEALIEKAERVVSRDKLLEKIWDDQPFVDENTLNVYMTRVRKKLKDIGIEKAVETIRGTGYIFHAARGLKR